MVTDFVNATLYLPIVVELLRQQQSLAIFNRAGQETEREEKLSTLREQLRGITSDTFDETKDLYAEYVNELWFRNQRLTYSASSVQNSELDLAYLKFAQPLPQHTIVVPRNIPAAEFSRDCEGESTSKWRSDSEKLRRAEETEIFLRSFASNRIRRIARILMDDNLTDEKVATWSMLLHEYVSNASDKLERVYQYLKYDAKNDKAAKLVHERKSKLLPGAELFPVELTTQECAPVVANKSSVLSFCPKLESQPSYSCVSIGEQATAWMTTEEYKPACTTETEDPTSRGSLEQRKEERTRKYLASLNVPQLLKQPLPSVEKENVEYIGYSNPSFTMEANAKTFKEDAQPRIGSRTVVEKRVGPLCTFGLKFVVKSLQQTTNKQIAWNQKWLQQKPWEHGYSYAELEMLLLWLSAIPVRMVKQGKEIRKEILPALPKPKRDEDVYITVPTPSTHTCDCSSCKAEKQREAERLLQNEDKDAPELAKDITSFFDRLQKNASWPSPSAPFGRITGVELVCDKRTKQWKLCTRTKSKRLTILLGEAYESRGNVSFLKDHVVGGHTITDALGRTRKRKEENLLKKGLTANVARRECRKLSNLFGEPKPPKLSILHHSAAELRCSQKKYNGWLGAWGDWIAREHVLCMMLGRGMSDPYKPPANWEKVRKDMATSAFDAQMLPLPQAHSAVVSAKEEIIDTSDAEFTSKDDYEHLQDTYSSDVELSDDSEEDEADDVEEATFSVPSHDDAVVEEKDEEENKAEEEEKEEKEEEEDDYVDPNQVVIDDYEDSTMKDAEALYLRLETKRLRPAMNRIAGRAIKGTRTTVHLLPSSFDFRLDWERAKGDAVRQAEVIKSYSELFHPSRRDWQCDLYVLAQLTQ